MSARNENALKAISPGKTGHNTSGTLTPLGRGQYICHGTQGTTLLSIGDAQSGRQGAAELRLRLRGRGIDPRSINCIVLAGNPGAQHRGILRTSLSGGRVSNFPAARHTALKGAAGNCKDALPGMQEVSESFELLPGLTLGEARTRMGVARMPKLNVGGAGNRPRICSTEFAAAGR